MAASARRMVASLVAFALVLVIGPLPAVAFTPSGFVGQDDPGSEFLGTLYPSVDESELSAPDLGSRIAVSGDLLVARGSGSSGKGIVYVYRQTGAGWAEEDFFVNPLAQGGDGFGVDLATDGETIFAGAYSEADNDDNVQDAGALYFYTFNGSSWQQQRRTRAHVGQFGHAVAVDGDILVVGAPYSQVSGVEAGSVCVYQHTESGWSHAADLTATDARVGDAFGYDVAIDGDTILVGAYVEGDDDGGAAYVFTGNGSDWSQRAKITSPNRATLGRFGYSVALQDGTAVIGAVAENVAAAGSGVAYVYEGAGSDWSLADTLVPTVEPASKSLGHVAIDGDTIACGANNAAYVFRRKGAGWTLNQQLMPDPQVTDIFFGNYVAVQDDEVFVGAPGDDGGGRANSGAIYRFRPSDFYEVFADETLNVPAPGVLHNDLNPTLSPLSAAIAEQPSHGTVSLNTNGSFTYEPDEDYSGFDEFTYTVSSSLGAASQATVRIRVSQHFESIAGANRYETAVEASKRSYPFGAGTVIIATGTNWPDALGGSALAGVVRGPLLLTKGTALPAAVIAEIERLGATDAYILGGTGAVSAAVESTLEGLLDGEVVRLAGANRYVTANRVADKVIELQGGSYSGGAFVATGANFPDALGASPLAASSGTPILLTSKNGTPYLPEKVDSAVILGGVGAVTAITESAVRSALGTTNVDRVGGSDRYDTAAKVAEHGVASGMHWDGVGIATGAAFPDALSGGAMLGSIDAVLLLTKPTSLSPAAEQRLYANRASIDLVHFIGGTGAVSQAVRDGVVLALP